VCYKAFVLETNFLNKYWVKNKLLLTMGLIAYFLFILSYTIVLSFSSVDGAWYFEQLCVFVFNFNMHEIVEINKIK